MKISPWMLVAGLQVVVILMLAFGGVPARIAAAPAAQQAPAPPADVQFAQASQRVHVERPLSLKEARIIIDAAMEYVRSQDAEAAIAVVDDNGNLISMDRTDGTSQFFGRFAVGKAVGAVALQQPTTTSADAYADNPQRFLGALSILQGEIILIRGGVPLMVGSRVVGGVGSAGFGPVGDEPAVAAGIDAWQRYRASLTE